jgi:hypothetical protein
MVNFYLFNKTRTIIVSNHPVDKVRKRFGYSYEIINTVKDESSIEVIKMKTLRSYPNYNVVNYLKKGWTLSEETKKKMSLAKIGRKMDEHTRAKISNTMKGKSNFEGKKHRLESRQKTASTKRGICTHMKHVWIYSPIYDKEKRIERRTDMPENYRLGRSQEIIEYWMYCMSEGFKAKHSTSSPKETQSN